MWMCRCASGQRKCTAEAAGEPGAVLAQSPSAGSRVDQSTMVKLTVAKIVEDGRQTRMGLSEDLEKIALQERELRLPRLDAQVAWELGTRIRAMALERGLTLVIDVRRFGQPLFYAALDGTTPDNAEWVRRKSNVVARFHRSSYGVGMTLKMKGTTLLER